MFWIEKLFFLNRIKNKAKTAKLERTEGEQAILIIGKINKGK